MKLTTLVAVVVLGCALAFYSQGCAQIELTTQCPANSTGVGFALAGSSIGNQALSMLGGMMASGMLMAKQGASAPPVTTATMSYKYLAIWGPDSGSLVCTIPPPPPPAPMVVTTGPPAAILH